MANPQSTYLKKHSGWESPFDSSPVEVPKGWDGGKVQEVSVGKYRRQWTDVIVLEHVTSYVAVEYGGSFDRVVVMEYAKQDGDFYPAGAVLPDVPVPDDVGDIGCAKIARDLMVRLNKTQ